MLIGVFLHLFGLPRCQNRFEISMSHKFIAYLFILCYIPGTILGTTFVGMVLYDLSDS